MTNSVRTIVVVGLGYVGLPLAAAFSRHFRVIGFDVNTSKINLYRQGIDPTDELGSDGLKASNVEFTTDPERIGEGDFIVIAVPTPVNGDKTPDLTPVKRASETVGLHMKRGVVVVYESTVYPGVTEGICRPLLECGQKLICGKDFAIGYSPERINPGDKVHRLPNITKIVSGMDASTLDVIADVYGKIIDAGIYRAPSIAVAEAAKLVENAQRDINIAFMNELAMVFDRMQIDTNEVLKAMNTKWNALGFKPGLVGGHCIGVDPYYFIYKAESLGYHSQIIAAGRRINDGMSQFVVHQTIRELIYHHTDTRTASVYIMGMTFKEDCPDTRNSRSLDIYHQLEDYGLKPKAVDPMADPAAFKRDFGIPLTPLAAVHDADCLIFTVAHEAFRRLTVPDLLALYGKPEPDEKKILIDVKSMYSPSALRGAGLAYWNL